MKLTSYLMFNGQCEAAFKFYEQCLGGKIVAMMTYGETPPEDPMAEQLSPEWRSKIMHTHLVVGDQELMGADGPPGYSATPGGFSVSISLTDMQQGEQIFHALAANGTVQMPFQQTFWAERFGMLVDQFGVPWMVNCEAA